MNDTETQACPRILTRKIVALEGQMTIESQQLGRLDPALGSASCDQNEAPEGYYAVLKPSSNENICRQCDWRPTCQNPTTDFLEYGHRCMSYAVTAFSNGKTYQRKDGCSVIFKKMPHDRAE